MTDYMPFPHVDLTLEGKVSGSVELVVRGSTALAMTSQSVLVSPTGKEYSCHLELVVEDGVVKPAESYGSRGVYTAFKSQWTDGYTDAPKTHAEAFVKAIVAAAQEVLTEELMAQGRLATATQALHSAEREAKVAAEAHEKAQAALRVAQDAHDAAVFALATV